MLGKSGVRLGLGRVSYGLSLIFTVCSFVRGYNNVSLVASAIRFAAMCRPSSVRHPLPGQPFSLNVSCPPFNFMQAQCLSLHMCVCHGGRAGLGSRNVKCRICAGLCSVQLGVTHGGTRQLVFLCNRVYTLLHTLLSTVYPQCTLSAPLGGSGLAWASEYGPPHRLSAIDKKVALSHSFILLEAAWSWRLGLLCPPRMGALSAFPLVGWLAPSPEGGGAEAIAVASSPQAGPPRLFQFCM